MSATNHDIVIGVLSLQGAFEEHQECIERSTGCKTIQVSIYLSIEHTGALSILEH